MIPSRTIKLGYPQERGPNGRRLCRWCKTEVPEGRIHWCSQACVEEYLVRSNPGHARRRVEERDKGVCAGCGVDTAQLKRVMRILGKAIWRSEHGGRPGDKYQGWKAALKVLQAEAARYLNGERNQVDLFNPQPETMETV